MVKSKNLKLSGRVWWFWFLDLASTYAIAKLLFEEDRVEKVALNSY